MKFGNFDLAVIRESSFRLDGGAMFGVVPKTLWTKGIESDEQNRVFLKCNLLVIDTGHKKVLVETGMGDRWTDKERERYGLETHVDFSHVLAEVGLKNEDIDAVIISHLHFDHVGGATRLVDGKLEATFPNAKYYAQKGEYEFSLVANARARASYRPDDYEPLKATGQLVLIDGDTEVVPGVFAKVTGGHTSHHQVVYFESEGKKGVFFADLMPTACHVSPPWVMGYDHYPLASCDVKSEWLVQAAAENWLVVFDHEANVPWGHVVQTANGKFDFKPLPIESLQHNQLVAMQASKV